MASRASGSVIGTPRSSAAARYHLARQLRQKPARFMTSMFWTSVRSRKCWTSLRNAAASSSVRVRSSSSVIGSSAPVVPQSRTASGGHRPRRICADRATQPPMQAASMSETVTELTSGGTIFHVVGTAHVSERSTEEVREIIRRVRPQVVCVELCKARYDALTQDTAFRDLDVFKVIREGKTLYL